LDLPHLHLQLEDWAATFGSFYRLKLLNREVLVVSDPTANAAILRDRPATWRRPVNFEPIFREARAHGLFSAEGDDWRRQRRMVMMAFDPAHLRRFMPQLVRVTERLRDRWSRAAQAGMHMDLQAELMCFSVDAASGLSFGVDINTIEDERSELHEHLATVFPILMRRINMPFPYWRYVRLPVDRAFDRHKAEIHRAIEGLVSQARDRVAQRPQDSGSPSDLLEAMLLGRDGDGSALSAEEVVGNVYTTLVASQDTTANSLAWTIYLLHTHPTAW
jgi:cytochrome P450